jgi:hypothetical protein
MHFPTTAERSAPQSLEGSSGLLPFLASGFSVAVHRVHRLGRLLTWDCMTSTRFASATTEEMQDGDLYAEP